MKNEQEREVEAVRWMEILIFLDPDLTASTIDLAMLRGLNELNEKKKESTLESDGAITA